MRHVVHDKYFLKDLLRDIDLYDRKLEHLRSHAHFETDAERDRAVRTATTRRDNLSVTARKLMAEGISYDARAVPASMLTQEQLSERQQRQREEPKLQPVEARSSDIHVLPAPPAKHEEEEQTPFGAAIERLQEQAKTAGMPQVNWKEELLDYKRKRNKIPA